MLLIVQLGFSPTGHAQVPASGVSRKAIKIKTPLLQKAFDSLDLKSGNPVFLRIFKESNELEIWIKKDDTYSLFKNYTICYYSGSLGTKTREGDCQAPEGFYSIYPKSLNPYSSYHLSINVGYPNAYDQLHGYTGNAIMIHGDCVSIGCYAMGDENIEEIWTILVKAFNNGQTSIPLHIFPFRMTNERLSLEMKNKWYPFWMNIKEGYELFEQIRKVPQVKIKNREYAFTPGR